MSAWVSSHILNTCRLAELETLNCPQAWMWVWFCLSTCVSPVIDCWPVQCALLLLVQSMLGETLTPPPPWTAVWKWMDYFPLGLFLFTAKPSYCWSLWTSWRKPWVSQQYRKTLHPPQLAAPENSLHPSENLPFSKSPHNVCWQKEQRKSTASFTVFDVTL